jgi:hypothetical protein
MPFVIKMPPPIPPAYVFNLFNPFIFFNDLIFTLIAVIFCFLIYFKTKDIYELTKYEGIKYFRGAFLFFGLSYLMRFTLGLMLFSRVAFDFFLPRGLSVLLFLLPLGYFSTIGIFYLIFGSIWKSMSSKLFIILGHSIAILLPLIAFLTRSQIILVILQVALLVGAIILSFAVPPNGKKFSQIKAIYILIAFLWLINLIIIDTRRPFPPWVEILFEVVSLIVFIVIYHKISKWVK